jgi:hypothetical protein
MDSMAGHRRRDNSCTHSVILARMLFFFSDPRRA